MSSSAPLPLTSVGSHLIRPFEFPFCPLDQGFAPLKPSHEEARKPEEIAIKPRDYLHIPPSFPTLAMDPSSSPEEPALGKTLLNNANIYPYPSQLTSQKSTETSSEEENYLKQLDHLEKVFNSLVENNDKHLDSYQALWDHLKNLHHCREELLSCLNGLVSSEQYELIGECLDGIYNPLKVLKPLGNAGLIAIKCVALAHARQELNSIQENIQKKGKLSQLKGVQKRVDRLSNRLREEQENALNESTSQAAKAVGNHLIAAKLATYAGLSEKKALKGCKLAMDIQKEFKGLRKIWAGYKQQKGWLHDLQPHIKVDFEITKEALQERKRKIEQFLEALNSCETIEEVKRLLKEANISLESIPDEIEEWKDLLQQEKIRKFLFRSYQYNREKTYFVNSEDLQNILDKKQQTFLQHMAVSQEKIVLLVNACSHLSFEEIKTNLAQEHIALNRIEGAPQSKEEWNQKIQDENFLQLLCKQRVDYCETVAQLLEQGARANLLNKIQTENQLLVFRGIESILGIVLTGLRIAFYLPRIGAGLEKYLLHHLVEKLPIPGLNLATLFCCDRDLTIDNLFMMTFHHCIAHHYKPNEYSLEGYKIRFQTQWANLMAQLHFCSSILKKLFLWIQIRVIEGCILRIQGRFLETDPRYQDLKYRINQYNLAYKANLLKLQESMQKLQLEDVKLLMLPHFVKMVNPDGTEENFDPLKNLNDALTTADFDCFSQDSLNFFLEHLGLSLKEENRPKLASQVERFFIQDGLTFAKSHAKNQASFLKT